MIKKETIIRGDIQFHITRSFENGFIIKNIEVETPTETHHFFERIKYLDLDKIKGYIDTVGLKLKHTFGDYDLQEYDPENSNRLILILQK